MKTFIMINGAIYRKYPKHWLKVSPWEKGEDRRLAYSEMDKLLETKKAKPIDKKYAYRIINKLFKEFSTDWFHEGALYKIMKDDFIENAPVHLFNPTGIKGIKIPYKLCWHLGTIFWVEHDDEVRVRLYKFEGLDKNPGTMVKFGDYRSLKPIYKLCYNKKTKKEYWKAI